MTTSILLKCFGAELKGPRIQGCGDDQRNFSQFDFPGDVETSACPSFHGITRLILLDRRNREDLVIVGVRELRQEVLQGTPCLQKPWSFNADEKARQILVPQSNGGV